MKIHFILGLAIISLGSVSTAAETSTDPGIRFIQAADTGDAVGMTVNLTKDVLKAGGGKLKPAKFLEMIKPCYLRRLYKDDNPPARTIMIWMCADDNSSSHTILANIESDATSALLWDVTVMKAARPAPSRTGSAFAK